MVIRSLFTVLLLVLVSTSFAEDGRSGSLPWMDPEGVREPVVFFAGDALPDEVRARLARIAGDANVRKIALSGDAPLIDPQALPRVIVAVGPLDTNRRDQFLEALSRHADHVGFVIDRGADLFARGRQLSVLGDSTVTVLLAASPGRPLLDLKLKAGATHDLTMLRRAARERSLASFPPRIAPAPVVEQGSLLIVGGGTLPSDVSQKFIELAGGPDAPIVVLPIAAEGNLPEDTSRDTRVLARAGATNVKSLRARSRSEVESPEFAAALTEAKGVWFNGGRQWRFVDAYMGTKAEELFEGVLRRGGVIGGSSPCASIQSQYMPRGSPLGNTDMMAEGYERGLGFLPGAAVDQHFTQRRRHADMTSLMRRWPQLLGIGIDESTAIVVHGSMAQVIGRGTVHFYDYKSGPPAGDRDFTPARAGERYDLLDRRLLTPSAAP